MDCLLGLSGLERTLVVAVLTMQSCTVAWLAPGKALNSSVAMPAT